MARLGEKTKSILKEILEMGGELALVPFKASRHSSFKPYVSGDNKINRKELNRTLKRLEQNGLIAIKESGEKTTVYLKKEGEKVALQFSVKDLQIKIPKKWDGRWRVVIFDVPDKHKVARNILKAKLDELGFKMVQKSVYAYPFPCEDEIEFVRSIYEVKPFVKIMTVQEIEDEDRLKNFFEL